MKIFNMRPPSGSNASLNRDFKIKVLCIDCQRKFKEYLFKEYLKNGYGKIPKACEACKDKLKNQMLESRYPDREK